jgi:hypothetical protein
LDLYGECDCSWLSGECVGEGDGEADSYLLKEGTAGVIEPPTQLYRTLFIENRQVLLGNCTKGQLTSIGQNQRLLGLLYEVVGALCSTGE